MPWIKATHTCSTALFPCLGTQGLPRLRSSWVLLWSTRSSCKLLQVPGRCISLHWLSDGGPWLLSSPQPVHSRAVCVFMAKVSLPGRFSFYPIRSGPPKVSSSLWIWDLNDICRIPSPLPQEGYHMHLGQVVLKISKRYKAGYVDVD